MKNKAQLIAVCCFNFFSATGFDQTVTLTPDTFRYRVVISSGKERLPVQKIATLAKEFASDKYNNWITIIRQ